jgi:hypothetical protein
VEDLLAPPGGGAAGGGGAPPPRYVFQTPRAGADVDALLGGATPQQLQPAWVARARGG